MEIVIIKLLMLITLLYRILHCLIDGRINYIVKEKERRINVYSRRIELQKLTFSYHSYKDRKLIIFLFTILEMIIDMDFKINKLCFDNISFVDLAGFLEKLKTLEDHLNINDIHIKIPNTDLKNIDISHLHQYSHLIKGKIIVKSSYYIDFESDGEDSDFNNINSK